MSRPAPCGSGVARGGLLTDPGRETPEALAEYEARGGYAGLRRVMAEGPEWALDALARARVRGRGAFGHLAAARWQRVARAGPPPRYVVGNGAEGSPASRKDRHLLALYPHRVLEGLLTAAWVLGAQEAYLYVRGDSPEALRGAALALDEGRRAGLFGPGGLVPAEVHLQPSASGPVAGEETAVIDALEGLEGQPQLRPPDPEECGLRGRPTLVQNVETLAAVAALFREGPERYAATGAPEEPGTALFTVSGSVLRPGVYEFPLGTPLSDVLRAAGAEPGGVQAVLPGGLWSPPLWPHEFDVPLTWEALARVGSALGNRAVVVLGREVPLATQLAGVVRVLAVGSCGQCQGCLNGTRALAAAVEALVGGAGQATGEREPGYRRDEAAEVVRHYAQLLTRRAGYCPYPEAVGRAVLRALPGLAPGAFPGARRGPG